MTLDRDAQAAVSFATFLGSFTESPALLRAAAEYAGDVFQVHRVFILVSDRTAPIAAHGVEWVRSTDSDYNDTPNSGDEGETETWSHLLDSVAKFTRRAVEERGTDHTAELLSPILSREDFDASLARRVGTLDAEILAIDDIQHSEPLSHAARLTMGARSAGMLTGRARFEGAERAQLFLFDESGPRRWTEEERIVFGEFLRELAIALERVFAGERIRLRAERYERFRHEQHVAVVCFSSRGIVELVNPLFERWCGRAQNELVGKTLKEFVTAVVHEEDQEAVFRHYQMMLHATPSQKRAATIAKSRDFRLSTAGSDRAVRVIDLLSPTAGMIIESSPVVAGSSAGSPAAFLDELLMNASVRTGADSGERKRQTGSLSQEQQAHDFTDVERGHEDAGRSVDGGRCEDAVVAADGFESFMVLNEEGAGVRDVQEAERYRRLVERTDALLFQIDLDRRIRFMNRRCIDFFGVPPQELVGAAPGQWLRSFHQDDVLHLVDYLEHAEENPGGFDEEIRAINRITGRTRHLLVRLFPMEDDGGQLLGWDGFGVDVTARRETQLALEAQSRKVRALYTVSSAIRGFLDPTNIANRGLEALSDATGASGGLCYMFESAPIRELPSESDNMIPVAYCGIDRGLARQQGRESSLGKLALEVARSGQPSLVADLWLEGRPDARQTERPSAPSSAPMSTPPNLIATASLRDVRSLVVVPITAEDETLGVLVLLSERVAGFDHSDVLLALASANQIGLAARQAALFTAHKKQTRNLAALYRMSHELSQERSLDLMFQHAFTIIRDELGLKRLWLGMLNDAGTRVVGQAAFGPGWRRQLVEMNVELVNRDHPLARVVRERKAIVIDHPREVLQEFGVKRVFSRLAIHSVALVPLISAGQVLGVLAVQPGPDDDTLNEERLQLLTGLASEIASVIVAKKLEGLVAEGERMRTSGLLAAGIAHNFNNLLQAIMGQASLLELQNEGNPRAGRAARIIQEASTKGAQLVRQLLSFANLEEPQREPVDLNDVIERSVAAQLHHLGQNFDVALKFGDTLPKVHVDPRQLGRVLGVLLSNAADAMGQRGNAEIVSSLLIVDEQNPHYEVPYGRYVRLSVRDFGVGMDEETKRRCFEPFFTTKNTDRASGVGLAGSGMGLAAAYALAKRNGGRLTVESKVGQGSVFTLYLPLYEPPRDADGVEVAGERARYAESVGYQGPGLRERIERLRDQGRDEGAGAATKTPARPDVRVPPDLTGL